MKVYVVDDDTVFSLQLESMLESIDGYEYVGRSDSFDSATKEINRVNPDIVIADIRLEDDHSGIDLAEEFNKRSLSFIFVTAYSDESVYNATKKYTGSKFIVKPFDVLTLKSLLDDVSTDLLRLTSTQIVKNDTLYFRKNNNYEKVDIQDLTHLYSEGNYITFFTSEKKFVLKYSLSKLLSQPKFSNFIRVHRSYAVHKDKIDAVSFAEKFLVVAEVKIPFGRTYVKSVRTLMSQSL